MDLFVFLIDALCVYRLARLITKDSLLDRPRWWILNRWPSEQTTFPDNLVLDRRTEDGHVYGILKSGVHVYMTSKVDDEGDPLWEADRTYKLSELVECPWCIGLWLAAIVVALRTFYPTQWNYVAVTLAFSALVGLIFTHWDHD